MSRSMLVGWLVETLAGIWVVSGAYLAGRWRISFWGSLLFIPTWPYWFVWMLCQDAVEETEASDD